MFTHVWLQGALLSSKNYIVFKYLFVFKLTSVTFYLNVVLSVRSFEFLPR